MKKQKRQENYKNILKLAKDTLPIRSYIRLKIRRKIILKDYIILSRHLKSELLTSILTSNRRIETERLRIESDTY